MSALMFLLTPRFVRVHRVHNSLGVFFFFFCNLHYGQVARDYTKSSKIGFLGSSTENSHEYKLPKDEDNQKKKSKTYNNKKDDEKINFHRRYRVNGEKEKCRKK